MKNINKCPRCKTKIELNGDNVTATYWMDNEGKFHWECFECNHEWIEDYAKDKKTEEEKE